MRHIPVLSGEALNFLNVRFSGTYVDATVGDGGHSELIAGALKSGRLICVDMDEEAIARSAKTLGRFGDVVTLVKSNFTEVNHVLEKLKINKIDGILFDLGVSSYQLEDACRGFSFRKDGPLDMRMDRSGKTSAEKIINTYPRQELERVIRDYGEERLYRKIVSSILERRQAEKITMTSALRSAITSVKGFAGAKDPATKVFQALRIEVNGELRSLPAALAKIPQILAKGGRIVVISYHSLEDRIVKNFFKANKDMLQILTGKPVVPQESEIKANPRSRSAKLRAAEKK